jgi:hypothetical protein
MVKIQIYDVASGSQRGLDVKLFTVAIKLISLAPRLKYPPLDLFIFLKILL